MREIKFRAWDGSHMLDEFKSQNLLFDDIDMPIMQYTGLKDKNGVEIYEGDVIRAYWFEDLGNGHSIAKLEPTVAPIQWMQQDACFAVQIDEDEVFTLARYERIEVIGNIYENPELLK